MKQNKLLPTLFEDQDKLDLEKLNFITKESVDIRTDFVKKILDNDNTYKQKKEFIKKYELMPEYIKITESNGTISKYDVFLNWVKTFYSKEKPMFTKKIMVNMASELRICFNTPSVLRNRLGAYVILRGKVKLTNEIDGITGESLLHEVNLFKTESRNKIAKSKSICCF